MNKGKRKTLIVSVLGLIISIVGVSYAFFMAKVDGNESESTVYGVAANLTIEFREGTSQISASDIFPGWSATKTFYVKNNSASDGEYSLKIFDVENYFMEESISFEITSTNGGANIEKRNLPTSDETLKDVIKVAGNTMQEYTVTVYYNNLDVDQSADLGQSFTFKIGIEEAIKAPAPENWYKSKKGTLLAGIKANYNEPTEPLTTPGQEVSAEDEAVMAATEDDYGTSYYFRGSVQNNYVAFAGMCWRIVRVTGDGSIKLVLYNYSSADCTQTGDDLAFARYSGETYTTAFNDDYDSNAYIGFMYGNASGTTYAETHANENKSTILTNLETWYENNLATYDDNLADTIWCNDKSTSDSGYRTEISYYGAYIRNVTNKTPNLICPDDKEGGNLSRFTVEATAKENGALDYKIGLLTLDEIVYAGYTWNPASNNLNYLKDNIGSSTYWWSLSPYRFDGSYARVWNAYGGYNVNYFIFYNLNSSLGLRPSLSLKSSTTITSGNGTASSPFVVN